MKSGRTQIVFEILRILDIAAGRRALRMAQVQPTEDGFTAMVMGERGQWYSVTVALTAEQADPPESTEFWWTEEEESAQEPEVEHVVDLYHPPSRRGASVEICKGCSDKDNGRIVLKIMCPVLGAEL